MMSCLSEEKTITATDDFALEQLVLDDTYSISWDKEYTGAGEYTVTLTGTLQDDSEYTYSSTYTIEWKNSQNLLRLYI